jgi:Fe2+ transport system protein FeoA
MKARLAEREEFAPVLALNEVEQGWKVEVVAYRSNGRRTQRLAELGFTPGTPVRILQRARYQPMLVCVRGTRLAIDQETAASLFVRVLQKSVRAVRGGRGWKRHFRRRRSGSRHEGT